ncbi:MAG: hypothetical protein KDA80_02590 [Planctomycetaceae bacterium]|nr:hypothetical protein [Planctomycetaceae bacterium]
MNVRALKAVAMGLIWSASLIPGGSTARGDDPIPQELFRYVKKNQPEFGWSVRPVHEFDNGKVHPMELVSQVWQGIRWEHALLVYEPKRIAHPKKMLLMISGGRTGRWPSEDDMQLGLGLAELCGARIATLHQVPNQPLLGDHVEDDLITETWLKYLETGDENWPLLFPMVKSAMQAMSALQQFSEQKWNQPIDGFLVTGASKRGWTSWLTSVVDDRVFATAPIVIDTLNFPVQIQDQWETWGTYSEQIDDYTRKGLVKREGEPRSEREERLWRMMDPYTYRSRLMLPKLLIHGSNDPYWLVDAVKNYWPDLQGPKSLLVVPNAGHGLDGGKESALTTLAVFFRRSANSQNLPQIQWSGECRPGKLCLKVESDDPFESCRTWIAVSDTHDFRQCRWEVRGTGEAGNQYTVERTIPDGKHLAIFAELTFRLAGMQYRLTSRPFTDERTPNE